ncbi:hypothetical protein LXL04_024644 [Taraxacum kok-saghyz]
MSLKQSHFPTSSKVEIPNRAPPSKFKSATTTASIQRRELRFRPTIGHRTQTHHRPSHADPLAFAIRDSIQTHHRLVNFDLHQHFGVRKFAAYSTIKSGFLLPSIGDDSFNSASIGLCRSFLPPSHAVHSRPPSLASAIQPLGFMSTVFMSTGYFQFRQFQAVPKQFRFQFRKSGNWCRQFQFQFQKTRNRQFQFQFLKKEASTCLCSSLVHKKKA